LTVKLTREQRFRHCQLPIADFRLEISPTVAADF